jgi:hypothetical protein
MDRDSSRWDSWSRKAGFFMTQGVAGGAGRFAQYVRRNTIRPS